MEIIMLQMSSFVQRVMFIIMFAIQNQKFINHFLHASIITNDGPMLLIIEGKWLETILHMTKFEFLNDSSKTSSIPHCNSHSR